MGTIVNMGALTLAQLLESAQDKGLELELEVSSAENEVLLDSIEKMSLEALPKSVRRGIDALVRLIDTKHRLSPIYHPLTSLFTYVSYSHRSRKRRGH
jgi:hypothetical protein